MSKSLKRVKHHLKEMALEVDILYVEVPTNTAQQAANVIGVEVDQIAKSVIFRGIESGDVTLFLTAGGNRVKLEAASNLAGEPLGKADAALIREQTGFVIGGVSPFGHINPIRAFMDPRLCEFAVIWAAAGTPHHMFDIQPQLLAEKTRATIANFTE